MTAPPKDVLLAGLRGAARRIATAQSVVGMEEAVGDVLAFSAVMMQGGALNAAQVQRYAGLQRDVITSWLQAENVG